MSLSRRFRRAQSRRIGVAPKVSGHSPATLACLREWRARYEGLYSRRAKREWERRFRRGTAERRAAAETACQEAIDACEALGERLVRAKVLHAAGLGR
jgi:hypothetical protein